MASVDTGLQLVPVILCGGAGSRLWPMSRDDKPKQFHTLFGQDSLIAGTLARLPEGSYEDIAFSAPCVIGSAGQAALLQEHLRHVDRHRLVLEPAIRDTAAAIAAVTAIHEAEDDRTLLLVLPSDARIDDADSFRRTVAKAARTAAATDAIMTIGIAPSRPETQYGYIETGDPLGEGMAVRRFREKPDPETARSYLESGHFLWNAGMFLFRAGRMADAFRALRPQIWRAASQAAARARREDNRVWLEAASFSAADKVSIDYAIMEKAGNIGVVPAPFAWDDLGSWAQLYDHAPKDEAGNAATGDVIAIEAKGNHVRAADAVVAVAGVDDLVIVAEDRKVLVTRRDATHLVKDVTGAYKSGFAGRAPHDRSKPAIRRWLFETCLPLWAQKGVDMVQGGVHEVLGLDGEPGHAPHRRLRVLARQIFSFAHGRHIGWQGAPPGLLRALFETLTETGWHAAEGGFIHLFEPDGSVGDDRRDSYDQAFALLALAALHRTGDFADARVWADRTLAFMDARLADPAHGGFIEDTAGTAPRRANPHMHFLEAMLAWHEATGEAAFLDRAEAVVDLFQARFFDPETGTLGEFFADDWSRLTNDPAHTAIEPGHHYEWAWLLLRFLDRRDRPGLEAQARLLFATARAFGHHAATGAAANAVQPDGAGLSSRARCWPQTEALKAAIAFERRGLAGASGLRARMIDVLFDHYLARPVPGGWMDLIDDRGRPLAGDMPASMVYHVLVALAEHLQAD